MNRKIKFRAWDEAINKMLYSNNHPEWDNNMFWGNAYWLRLMQFTWLYDSNWKEIYEFDLIDYKWVLYKIYFNKYKISLENIFNWDIIDLTDKMLSDLSIKWNIYEN